jgi:hypothetical protein
MALIKCSECGKDVSSNAASCPNCGNPVTMKSGPFGGLDKGVPVRPDFWHDPNVGCVGCLVFVVIPAVLFLMQWIEKAFR